MTWILLSPLPSEGTTSNECSIKMATSSRHNTPEWVSGWVSKREREIRVVMKGAKFLFPWSHGWKLREPSIDRSPLACLRLPTWTCQSTRRRTAAFHTKFGLVRNSFLSTNRLLTARPRPIVEGGVREGQERVTSPHHLKDGGGLSSQKGLLLIYSSLASPFARWSRRNAGRCHHDSFLYGSMVTFMISTYLLLL